MDALGGPERAGHRAARTFASVAILRRQIADWLRARRADDRFSRFRGHFDVLEAVLFRMLDALEAALRKPMPDADDGVLYERCRALDAGILHVRRTFAWYAEKYDQRLDESYSAVLLAADELVMSCWSEPFAALRRPPPTGPLCYLDSRFDAFATPRKSPPPDLRAPGDEVVAEHVRVLPIPTIALPEVSVREPWWLVLAAHETGHHVQKDLRDDVESTTRTALAAATGELADNWSGWALEAFADAYSILMVGPAAAWAIDELQYGQPKSLVTAPDYGDRYPPPAVRLALLGELSRCMGIDGQTARHTAAGPHSAAGPRSDAGPDLPPSAAETRAWLAGLPPGAVPPGARAAVERHLAVTPATAKALVELPIGDTTLGALSGLRAGWFAAGGPVRAWSRQLGAPNPVLSPLRTRHAARLAIAAAVARRQELATRPAAEVAGQLELVRANLLRVLPACGTPGVLAPAPAPEVATLADALAARLVNTVGGGGL